MKYIVANSYGSSGCDGPILGITSINADQCYYATEECKTNPNLGPECEYLQSMSIGLNVSLIGKCKNGAVLGDAYVGNACSGNENALMITSSLSLPVNSCLLNVT